MVLLTCDAANNRLLLFVIDESLSLINEYDLTKTYRLSDYITSPASAIVDSVGLLSLKTRTLQFYHHLKSRRELYMYFNSKLGV